MAVAFGIGLFFINYRIFLNPFQVISYEDIEKNKQGICIDENRKLSRQELLSRAMSSYFDYYRNRDIIKSEDEKWYKYCSDDGKTTNHCWITKLPNWTISDYLDKSQELNWDTLERISFVDASEEMKIFKHPNSYSFLFYSDNETIDFYPHDCCSIQLLSELEPIHFPLRNTPKYFRERGIGNYFLNKKMLNLDLAQANLDFIFNNTYLINNCGNFSTEYYHQGETHTNLKNATTNGGFAYQFTRIEQSKGIYQCRRWKGDELPTDLMKENLVPERRYLLERESKIYFLKDSFYDCF